MGEPGAASTIARFVAHCMRAGVPDEVAGSVRLRLLDTVGVALAALDLPSSAAVARYATDQGGRAQATALGLPAPVPAPLAALVNGTLAHSLDFDDTHLPSVLHPSASVVPAALAVAEQTGADGTALIRAIAAGLEVCVRLGMVGYDPARRTSLFFEQGQHATSICGTLGAAASAAALYGMRAGDIAHALTVAASMGAGLIEANRTGGTVKRLHCGWAAHAGIGAAQLVRAGITGPPTGLEGRFGFFRAWLHRDVSADDITAGLGRSWEVPRIFVKPYPANHFTHAAADAAIRLRARGLHPAAVAAARVGVAAPTLRTVGEPAEVKQAPRTGYQAQFSVAYVVAAALSGGTGLGLGLADFTDDLARDPARRALMRTIDVYADERCSAVFPAQFPAVLEVRTTDGQVLREEVFATRGGPENPLSDTELRVKFLDNATRAVTVRAARRAADGLLALADGKTDGPGPVLDRLGRELTSRRHMR